MDGYFLLPRHLPAALHLAAVLQPEQGVKPAFFIMMGCFIGSSVKSRGFLSSWRLPLDLVCPIRSAHLAFSNVRCVSCLECLVSLGAIRRTFDSLLTKANGFHQVTRLSHYNVAFGLMPWGSFGFVVARDTCSSQTWVFRRHVRPTRYEQYGQAGCCCQPLGSSAQSVDTQLRTLRSSCCPCLFRWSCL